MFFSRPKPPKDPEPPPVGSHDRRFRGLFAGIPVILVLVAGSVFLMLLFLNSRFVASVNDCRDYYPGAQVISEEQPYFLQPFGELASNLYSPDAPEVVTEWFNRSYGSAMRSAIEAGDFTDVAPINWSVTPAEDGGSHILVLCS
ncbi:MAG TPA: hypothetical protein VER79_13745 [Candidatus Limnocylindrales bacterium]|nr:hypothetical protein [Candidatus Limnocylindrales bacterium]